MGEYQEYHAGSDIIEADCKLLLNKTTCSGNPSCHWLVDPRDPQDPGSCKRDGTTVTTDELNQMLEASLKEQKILSTNPSPIPTVASRDKKVFIVKKLLSNSDQILKLLPEHFLKFRTQAPYPESLRHNETTGLKDGFRKGQAPLSLRAANDPATYNAYLAAADKFYSIMRENPIFLYAHEQPVEVLLPKEYAGTIGTVSITPEAAEETRILILPDPSNPRNEITMPSTNTTVLFKDEVYDAGGGRRTRKTRKTRKTRRTGRSRKTRTLCKRNGCKLRKRINTRHTRHTRHTRPRK